MRWLPCLILILAGIAASAQQVATDSHLDFRPDPQPIVWEPNHPGWDQVLVDGHWFRTAYSDDGIGVKATVGTFQHYSAAVVTVFNHSTHPIEVRPETAYLYELKPVQRRFAQIDASRVEKSIGRRSAARAALVGFLGGLGSIRTTQEQGTFDGEVSGTTSNGQTVNGTISGTYHGSATTTDPEAAQRAADNARAVRHRGTQTQGLIEANALLPNTVMPGRSITGFIFFERASEKDGTTFNMIVGENLFVLPFWFNTH